MSSLHRLRVSASVCLLLLGVAVVLLLVEGVAGQSGSCSSAPSPSTGVYYFTFSAQFEDDSTPPVTFDFSLLLGGQFEAGDSPTSANAQYLLTSVSGNVQRSDMTDPISISTVAPVSTADGGNDNRFSPYDSRQLGCRWHRCR